MSAYLEHDSYSDVPLFNWTSTDWAVQKEEIDELKDGLLKLANMTEDDVIEIFIQPGEERVVPEEYDFQMPLYHKMVWRFRNEHVNGHPEPCYFLNGCDPGNQHKVFAYFDIKGHPVKRITQFLGWIRNGLSDYYLGKIEGVTDEDKERWDKENSIHFYFNSSDELKQGIIDYNTRYHQMMATR